MKRMRGLVGLVGSLCLTVSLAGCALTNAITQFVDNLEGLVQSQDDGGSTTTPYYDHGAGVKGRQYLEDTVVPAVLSGDVDTLQGMFSENAREDDAALSVELERLCEECTGTLVSVDRCTNDHGEGENAYDGGYWNASYRVYFTTSDGRYVIDVETCEWNRVDPSEVGFSQIAFSSFDDFYDYQNIKEYYVNKYEEEYQTSSYSYEDVWTAYDLSEFPPDDEPYGFFFLEDELAEHYPDRAVFEEAEPVNNAAYLQETMGLTSEQAAQLTDELMAQGCRSIFFAYQDDDSGSWTVSNLSPYEFTVTLDDGGAWTIERHEDL